MPIIRSLISPVGIAATVLAATATPGLAAEKPEPFLGAYLHLTQLWEQSDTPEAREKALVNHITRFKTSGLKVLIPFVVTTRGTALYNSSIIKDCTVAPWDPLAVMVREARQRGLKIYPTICVLNSGDQQPKGILQLHPEWALRDKEGKPLGFISAGHPEARAWVISVLKEIATNYQPDGLLLDYLRFPGNSAGLDALSQAEFDRQSEARKLKPGTKPYSEALLQYKRDCLTGLVEQIRTELRKVNPQLRIAVYMWGPHELTGTRDWATWTRKGCVDMLNLTGYLYRANYGEKYMDVLKERIRMLQGVIREAPNPVELTVCVGVRTSHGQVDSATHLQEYLRVAKQSGVDGLTFFTWSYLEPYLPELTKANYLNDFQHADR